MKILTLIQIISIVTILLEACGTKENANGTNSDSLISETRNQKTDDLNAKWEKIDEINDSISLKLYKKFPTALNIDSIADSYSIFLQKGLEKSKNVIFIKEAFIKDIREYKGKYLITTYSFFPKVVTSLIIEPQLAEELLNRISKGSYESCCLIANIKSFVPVTTDLVTKVDDFTSDPEDGTMTEDDVEGYVHLTLDSGFSPTYFMRGIILEIDILK